MSERFADSARNLLASLAAHAAVAGMVGYFVMRDPPQVAGGAGRAGSLHAAYDVTLAPVESRPAAKAPKAAAADEGVEIPLPRELPREPKHPDPVEIERPAAAEARPSEGRAADAAPGAVGQGGSSDTRAERVGNSDRTNPFGLYLQKVHRKIQAAIESPGYLPFGQKTMLRVLIRRDGAVGEIEVVKTSGDPALDRRAIQAVRKAQPFEPVEKELNVTIPVLFNAS